MATLHYVLLFLTALIMACQFVATNFPQYAALAHGLAGIAASVMPMLGALSPQLTGASTPATPAPSTQPAPAPKPTAAPAAVPTAGPVAAGLVAQDAGTLKALEGK